MPVNSPGYVSPLVIQVDDNEDDLELARTAIDEIAGERVHYIGLNDGVSAMTFLRESLQPPRQAIALLILDINMPGTNGWDVLGTLEQEALAAGIPIVMLSGSRGKVDRERAARFGIPYYVKPITYRELALLLQELLISRGLIPPATGLRDAIRS